MLSDILLYSPLNNNIPVSTAVIPAPFSAVFTHVVSPPVLTVPMPPLPAIHRPTRKSNSRPSGERTIKSDVEAAKGQGQMSLASLPAQRKPLPHATQTPVRGRQPNPAIPTSSSPPPPPLPPKLKASPLVRSRSDDLSKTGDGPKHAAHWGTVPRSKIVRNSSVGVIADRGHTSFNARSPLRDQGPTPFDAGHTPPVPALSAPPPLPPPSPVPVPSDDPPPKAKSRKSTDSSPQSPPPADEAAQKSRTSMIHTLAAESTSIGAPLQIEVFPLSTLR